MRSSDADAVQTFRPVSVDDLATALRESTGTVGVTGRGTKQTWGGRALPTDVEIGLTALDGIVEHAAGDLVVTVRAGTRLADLQQALASAGQWLPLDPPEQDASIGGILATAASGPRRLRFGTPRDLLIGCTVVLPDGTVARSGGKVVKNVAGYDLGKLFTGAYGTLGVVATATLRLHPRRPARRVVSVAAGEPGQVAAALAATQADPVAAEWDGATVHVLLETAAASADARAAALATALGGTVADELPPGFGARPWAAGDVAVKVTHRLSALDAAVAAARECLRGARLAAHVGSGVVWAGWAATPDEAAVGVAALRARIGPYDGTVVVVDAPAAVKQVVDVWGPVAGRALMQRIREQFDPQRRMNPGRFVGDD